MQSSRDRDAVQGIRERASGDVAPSRFKFPPKGKRAGSLAGSLADRAGRDRERSGESEGEIERDSRIEASSMEERGRKCDAMAS